MLQTIQDFEDSTTFERFAIESVYPLVNPAHGSAALDLRSQPGNITLGMISVVNGHEEARTELINNLRPLLFGSAWKIFDLLLEVAFYLGGLRPPKGGSEWRIADKVKHARAGAGSTLPICSDTAIWTRLTLLYANTEEARHCLIHRRFNVDSTGLIHDIRDRAGASQPDITALQQEAMCRLALALVDITIAGALDTRDRLNLVWWLDHLVDHHGQLPLGGAPKRPVEVIIVNASRSGAIWTIDTAEAQARAHKVFPGRPYFDVEIHFPDSGVPPLGGRLEEAPQGPAIEIDPSNAPEWLRY